MPNKVFNFRAVVTQPLAETGGVEAGEHASDFIDILFGQESHGFDLWKR